MDIIYILNGSGLVADWQHCENDNYQMLLQLNIFKHRWNKRMYFRYKTKM